MKNFVKALDKDGQSFRFLHTKFPYVSDAKFRAGVFDGRQTPDLIKDSSFDEILIGNKKTVWVSFENVCTNFFGKRRRNVWCSDAKLPSSGCSNVYKMHFLHSHLDYFPENCDDYSEEQGERFYQDISCMEERY